MFQTDLDLRAVQIFLAVAENESIKVASEFLKISSPAISQALRQLEKDLSAELFDRDVRPLRLTSSGRKLYREGAVLLEAARSLKKRVSEADYSFQFLRLGLGESATATISPFLLAKLRGKVENFTVVSSTWTSLLNKLKNDEIDVLLGADPLIDDSQLTRQEVYREEFLLISSKQINEPLNLEHLHELAKTRPYISYGPGSFDYLHCDRYLRTIDVKPVETVLASSSYTITGLVKEIDGWALLTPTNALGGKTFLDDLTWKELPNNRKLTRSTWVVGDKTTRAEQVRLVSNLTLFAMEKRFFPLISEFAPGLEKYIHLIQV